MSAREWTPAQTDAIHASGGTVLVSAAAGSGKTAVMVERILRRLTDPENPVAANRLLVVTFTNAAAAELRRRIGKELNERLKADPTNALIRRQILLLPTAHICTTHAFCATLLRDQFHLLDLSPDFKVLDDKQAALLKDEAITATMEEAYAAKDDGFLQLADLLGSSRDDSDVVTAIRKLHTFMESFPFPDEWLDAQLGADEPATLDDTLFDRVTRDRLTALVDRAEATLSCGFSVITPDTDLYFAYEPIVRSDTERWEQLRAVLETGSREELIAAVTGLSFDTLPRTKKDVDAEQKEVFQEWRKRAKAIHKEMLKWFEHPDDQLLYGQQLAVDAKRALVRAARRFDRVYRSKKEAAGGLDFADLEHYALALLYDAKTGEKTATASEIATRFDEILVDEYQDTNRIQEALFRAISQNEQNLFYVGDVKQSIYSFRQACPQLFLDQREKSVPYDGAHFPAAIFLGNNFRSRREVTEAINDTFSLLMRREFCGIEYNEDEQLVCSAPYPSATDSRYRARFTLVDLEGLNRSEWGDIAEARAIATDILRMKREMTVWDKNGPRPARYRDFCILLRSKSAHDDAYIKTLEEFGIPASTDGRGGFFRSPEIGVLTSLLRFLDNPTLDIPLASVMFSPLFRFTVDEMAAIRSQNKSESLFSAVVKVSRGEGTLADKCRAFLSQTERWRTLSPVLTVDRLLERIYDDAAIMDLYGVQKNGTARVANLQQLYRFAARFEENGYRGISAFVRLCDRMEETGQDFDPAAGGGDTPDSVSVISIHHSKGLEFPFVFLAGCPVGFNTEDTTKDLLLHKEAGIGLRLHDRETLVKYETPTRLAAKQMMLDEARQEELRILYVAMTRAKEQLSVVAAVNRPESLLSRQFAPADSNGKLPLYAINSADSYLDWLLPVLLLHPDGGDLRRLGGISDEVALPMTSRWDIHITTLTTLATPHTVAGELAAGAETDTEAITRWQERIAWEYPYKTLEDIPNKLTVTAIAHRDEDEKYVAVSKPMFLQAGGLSPAARGTATHAFMQFADYAAAAESVETERDRLVQNGWLTPLQGEALDLPSIRTFFESALYKRMAASDTVWREFPFITERPARVLYPDRPLSEAAGEELIAIQGVADCLFVEPDGIVVVDYKTDRVKHADTLRKRYAAQVQLYAEAVSAALEKPVKQCLLWSFALGEAIELPTE